ncbi:MAG: ATP-dependent Clp protease adaptor ClpS [Treponema sp.]|nr:ATP-dependent Clp protease adaptor ClpS [Treponema sp.]MDE6244056.1 ATP-dependent Clp protease adaptor ClpS [Treponemataceae bacterium]MBD5404182.1 ATP-dependent Clp protease adaptor ClpS [Treponema sp.]MBD5407642.1 ATP-dependent Clp protease adaptor ClpS [Treponema sp.]MBD5409238.1 ATP-dependent Clp protease adaptor ClpS [Treponema sp.]
MMAMEIEIPPECCVVFYNDDHTKKQFVVDVLMSVFGKEEEEAFLLMEKIHNDGAAVIGVYTYDIAATRATIAKTRAKKKGFPLRIEVKK